MLEFVALAMALISPPAAGAEPACAYTAGPATVPVAGHPFTAQPTADGCWLFVSLSETAGGRGGVAVLHNDGGRFVQVRTVPLAEGAAGLSLSHQRGRLLVTSGDSVVEFDVARLESGQPNPEVGRIREPSGAQPIYVALSADDRLAFVTDERAARVTVYDLARAEREGFGPRAVIGRIAQGIAPVGMALSPDGAWLYATSQRAAPSAAFPKRCRAEQQEDTLQHPEGFLSIIDVAKAAVDPGHALRAAVPAGCNPVRVALSSDGRTAWVTARGEDAVYAIDLADPAAASGASRRHFAVGSSPVGVAVQPGSGRVWVSDSGRFSTADGELQTVPSADISGVRVPSGRFPRDLRFLPDGRPLVVAVFGSQTVQLVPTPSIIANDRLSGN